MALANLKDRGYKRIVVQSMQVVPGSEFHQTASAVSGLGFIRGKFGFEGLEVGMPLLTGIDDCRSVSAALGTELGMLNKEKQAEGQVADSSRECRENEAVVLMGHGTSHTAQSAYSQMAAILQRDYGNVFLGTMDAFPGVDEILVRLNKSGIKKIKLMPFLLVAGGHAQEDLAGDGPASWKSIFSKEGIQTEVHLKGLAENGRILGIFLEHTKQAIERLEKSRAAKD
jgi:sirohydrochlorin cobaltochelatase